MTPSRILYLAALKFAFRGLLATSRTRVTASMRRTYWQLAKADAEDTCTIILKGVPTPK